MFGQVPMLILYMLCPHLRDAFGTYFNKSKAHDRGKGRVLHLILIFVISLILGTLSLKGRGRLPTVRRLLFQELLDR